VRRSADRILCFQIVARPNRRWLLRFISNAFAETDTPETLLELIKQRRRWLNGCAPPLLHGGQGTHRRGNGAFPIQLSCCV
jgi:hypothetical protein